jgi:Regulator of chromosome condensation (RCC1) repeat
VVAWGDNANGQLGDGTLTNSAVPVPVSGLAGAKTVSAGGLLPPTSTETTPEPDHDAPLQARTA